MAEWSLKPSSSPLVSTTMMPSRRRLLHSLLVVLQLSLGAVGITRPEGSGDVKQIAVIGAGAAGSSAAYHLRKYADESGIAVNVTMFERTGRIGGRTLTVNIYGDPAEPIELGASIFVKVNYVLFNATRDFGLVAIDPGADEDGLLGIWDGDSFVYTLDTNSSDWFTIPRLLWKYGIAPFRTRRLVQRTIATFLKLYEEPFFPFKSLSARAFQLGLAQITGITGQQFLAANNLAGSFAHDIVQAGTRVNYASDLRFIHGLCTMVAMAPEGAVAIEGGNWKIFENMVTASRADLHLNTRVLDIALKNDRKYVISMTESTDGENLSDVRSHPVDFDDVIIAAPIQFANINIDQLMIQQPIEKVPYATLHVTLFASPCKFSPAFFKMPPNSDVPISVLTTSGTDEQSLSGQPGAGKAGFYSATLQRTVTNPNTHKREYVYKIFSPDAVTPGFLSELLGVKVPETFTQISDVESDDADSVSPISWIHATIFHPYPQLLPRTTFQDPILRDGIYYTSGMESFISTMETSALMGMNVARLIIDEYAGITRVEEELDAGFNKPMEEDELPILVQQEKNMLEGDEEIGEI